MDDLINQLNSLQSYPSINDLHALSVQLQAYSEDDTTKLLAALTNPLLAADIKRLLSGAMPSTMFAPVHVQPTAPTDPDHPGVDDTKDPGAATGTAPEIKPPAA